MTTSYNAQDMQVQLDDINQGVNALRAENSGLRQALGESNALLQSIAHLLNKAYGLKDVSFSTLISPTPITLDRQGRNYLLIFSPVAVNNVTVNVMGITGYQFNLASGWTVLNFPDGTTLTGPLTSSQQVVIKATNWYQGNAI